MRYIWAIVLQSPIPLHCFMEQSKQVFWVGRLCRIRSKDDAQVVFVYLTVYEIDQAIDLFGEEPLEFRTVD